MISTGDPSGRVNWRNAIPERCRNARAHATILEDARALTQAGDDDAATRSYLAILADSPTHRDALVELGSLAAATHHLAAARTAFAQAVAHHPDDPAARTGLADRLADADPAEAARHYRHALARNPAFAPAHRGLATILADDGDHEAAEPHWRQAFPSPVIPPRAPRPGAIPLLLLVASRGGNIPTAHLIDRTRFATTALYADLFDPGAPLPPHALLFNTIGDPDFAPAALDAAAILAARSTAPIVNPPGRVRLTSRQASAARLAAIPHLVAPRTRRLSRAAAATLAPPVLLRAPGFHTGRHFHRATTHAELSAALAALPGPDLLAIGWLDARGSDGLFRKYRAIAVGGVLHPLHLAISADWKVHYMTAAMGTDAALRTEEARFLADMPATLGARAMRALQSVADTLALDYAGIDFGLTPDGAVLFFEANATMFAGPPGPDPIWDYRRPAVDAILGAVDTLLRDRAARSRL